MTESGTMNDSQSTVRDVLYFSVDVVRLNSSVSLNVNERVSASRLMGRHFESVGSSTRV